MPCCPSPFQLQSHNVGFPICLTPQLLTLLLPFDPVTNYEQECLLWLFMPSQSKAAGRTLADSLATALMKLIKSLAGSGDGVASELGDSLVTPSVMTSSFRNY